MTLRKPEAVYGLHFTDREIQDAVDNNKLLTLDIETSRICNFKCVYCYAGSGKKLSNELSFDELKNVILQARDLDVRNITVIGGGEPFLYPHFMELVTFIKELGIQENIFTNGTLITKDLAQELLGMKIQLVAKLNSLKPEVQDYLAGVKGVGVKILKNLEMLQEIGYNKNNMLGVESIICKQNYPELPEMWRWARDRGIIPYFEMITFQGRAKLHDLNVGIPELEKLFRELLKIDEEHYGFTWDPHPPIAGLSCDRHYYNLVVASNGYVTPCVGVDIKVGNIRHSSLKDIIAKSAILQSIRHMKENIHGSCATCRLSEKCYGCRGMAYHLTGDVFASDPLCWNNEKHIDFDKTGNILVKK